MRELLAGLVPGLPEAAVRAIVSAPTASRCTRSRRCACCVAEGRLVAARRRLRPVGDLPTLAVPETLTALIAARLDALDPTDRALLQDAAVLGQSFTLGRPGGRLRRSSRRARAAAARRWSGASCSRSRRIRARPERGQYAFVQALIREVAYNTLAKRDRKARHLAAARWFESLGNDELAGALAGHYLAAHENAAAGPEADALAVQARVALRAAADRASRSAAHDQAVAFMEQALTVTTDEREAAELRERAGAAASAGGRHEAAEAFLTRALEQQKDLGDRGAQAGTIASLAYALLDARRTDVAVKLLEQASDEFADMRSNPDVIRLEGQLARAYFFTNQDRRAVEVADRVLEAAERADLVPIVADTLVTRGVSLANLGRMYEGVGELRTGEELADAHGLTTTVLRARINRSAIQINADPRAAFEVARSGLALARRLGLRSSEALLAGNASTSAWQMGEWDSAVAEMETTLAEDLEPTDRMNALQEVFNYRLLRGEQIEPLLAELDAVAAESSDPMAADTVALARAEADFHLGRFDQAAEAFARLSALNAFLAPLLWQRACRAAIRSRKVDEAKRYLDALNATGVHGAAIDASRRNSAAGIAALEGRTIEALALYRAARRAWQDLGLPVEEAMTATDMAYLLDPDEPDVADATRAARELFARLRAPLLLERLDAAIARPEPAANLA